MAIMEIVRCTLASVSVERSSSLFDAVNDLVTRTYDGRYLELGEDGKTNLASNCTTWLWHNSWPIIVFKRRGAEKFDRSPSYEFCAMHKSTLTSFITSVQSSDISTEVRFNTEYSWISNKQAARKPESIVATPILDILEDARKFMNSRKRYAELGIPFRRGYLFEGMPGTGKSSCALCLAGELRTPLCFMNITEERCSDAWLLDSMSRLPDLAVVLFDDFDRIDFSITKGVTVSGMLNALDGAVAQTGKIIVIAVNDSSNLPQAVLRPGRIDRRFHNFTFLTKEEARQLFVKFHGEQFSAEFAEYYPGLRTAATVVSHLMLYETAELAAEQAVNL